MALTIAAFETADWTASTTPKTISVTGALSGDLIVVMYGGNNGTVSAVTAATVSTTGGSTGAWTEPEEGLAAISQGWVSSSTASVTANGTVTVSLARTQTTAREWGGMALLVSGHNGIGTHARSAPSAAETVNLTVSQNSAVGVLAIDWDALATVAFSPSGATDVERAVEISNYTAYAGYWTGQAAGTRGYGIATSSTTNLHIIAIEVLEAASIPYSPQRVGVVRDSGEQPWLQRDRRNANLVATAANPLVSPLDSAWQAGARLWHTYNDWGSRRFYPQQRAYVSTPGLLATAELEDVLLGGAGTSMRTNLPATHADRRLVPWQRTAITGPDVSAVVAVPGPIPMVPWRRDPVALQQRQLESPPDLLGSALLENVLLGGAETGKRTNVPATHVDRRLVPQYTLRGSPYGLLDTGLLEVPPGVPDLAVSVAVTHLRPGWLRQKLTQADQSAGPDFDPTQAGVDVQVWRRDPYPLPQRVTLVDQSSQPGAPDFDPTLAGYPSVRWRRDPYPLTQRSYPTPGLFDLDPTLIGYDLPPWRRDPYPPVWRPYVSPAGLLDTALLENELLGSATTWIRLAVPATHADRREVPQQRLALVDVSVTPTPADPTLLGWLVNWLADNRAATHVDRRLVPAQRPYISDPSTYPTVAPADPLTLAWGVSGPLWHLYNDAALRDRREVPQQRTYWADIPISTDPILSAWLPLWLAQNGAAYGSRRLVPQQPKRESDPNLLATALLEDVLLGGGDDLARHRAWYTDRRLYPQQRPVFGILGSLADPLLIVGADWRRRLTPATHAPRWVLRPWWQTQQFQGGALVFFQGVITGAALAGPSAVGGVRIGPMALGHVLQGTIDFFLDLYGDVYLGGEGSVALGAAGTVSPGPGATGKQQGGATMQGGSR